MKTASQRLLSPCQRISVAFLEGHVDLARWLISAAWVAQSPAESRCQATATSVWMPSVQARIAAGISVASWKSAVLRAWSGRPPPEQRRQPTEGGRGED
jgi:hypothetical protein